RVADDVCPDARACAAGMERTKAFRTGSNGLAELHLAPLHYRREIAAIAEIRSSVPAMRRTRIHNRRVRLAANGKAIGMAFHDLMVQIPFREINIEKKV